MPSDTVIHSAQRPPETTGPARIAELWPDLPDNIRAELLDIAEAAARGDGEVEFNLTPEELASVEAAKRDFADGRTLAHDEAVSAVRRFIADLARKK